MPMKRRATTTIPKWIGWKSGDAKRKNVEG
jgi:hypothetical protein